MALFVSQVANKLDAKFRVSVPSSFRKAVTHDKEHFHGVMAWPGVGEAMIEACDHRRIERIAESLDDMTHYPEDAHVRLGLARASLAALKPLAFDINGRILLPEEFRQHAKIVDEVLFVGVGTTFQMWQPTRYRLWEERLRSQGEKEGIHLHMRPLMGALQPSVSREAHRHRNGGSHG
ncbi:MAG: division/cell wall cluster transcriptional repressor MraZ [Alphaproteobacteria bacterium GM7ARS4]|nr:division/cell wall cluster transcriptional repressor MraZ [Alphaproteobacteria bacterium GM7ARS4]